MKLNFDDIKNQSSIIPVNLQENFESVNEQPGMEDHDQSDECDSNDSCKSIDLSADGQDYTIRQKK